MTKTTNKKRLRINYRHYVCIAITFGIILLGVFVFPNTLGRTVESFRDLGYSVVYSFCRVFAIPTTVTPTVTEAARIPFWHVPFFKDLPTAVFPTTWTDFKLSWSAYWKRWIALDNFTGYCKLVGNIVVVLLYIALVLAALYVVYVIAMKIQLHKVNNDYNTDSRPLRAFKRVAEYTYYPVKRFISELVYFIREHRAYLIAWLCLFLWYFNVLTIAIELIAYLVYFVFCFDVGSLYMQVYKLAVDLTVPFKALPLWLWAIVAFFVLNGISKRMAFGALYHNERKNRGFINERGVVTVVYGAMGVGKTTQITDMALSAEIQFRDTAFEIILDTDMQFPFFPWINLENELKYLMSVHSVYDVPSCRRWVYKKFARWRKNPTRQRIFDYDYERYGTEYDNKLELVNVWSAIENYACAYLIYTVQSSLLISNYSIRSDNLISDLGNFPLWNTDFFKRDSKLIDSYSRHAHILDFDMLRLGKQMLEHNPNGNAFGFGVYIISEIDKERKNSYELQDKGVKGTANECNQKTDLFNVLLKMSRHACVVANKVFVKAFADLQRPSSLGADALELGEVVDITGAGDMMPTLPFFSPFWLFDLLYCRLKPRFDNFYVQYRYARGDNTLLLHLFKCVTALLTKYRDGMYNLFGCEQLALEVERGSREGTNIKSRKYYRMPKKIYSKRFATNCLSGIFEARAALNYVGIDDLNEYADIMATSDELREQHSHFQKEIHALNSANNV